MSNLKTYSLVGDAKCHMVENERGEWVKLEDIKQSQSIELLIEQMQDEFVGFWKYHPTEFSDEAMWCASVLVDGKLIDTTSCNTMYGAIKEALEIVEKYR